MAEYVKCFDAYAGQKVIDFKKAKQDGYELVILKASEALFADPMFYTNWNKALEAEMYVLTYHFFRGNVNGVSQAAFHLETIQPFLEAIKYKSIAFADVETSDGVAISTRARRLSEWWQTINNYSDDLRAGTYSNAYYWKLLMNNMVLPADVFGWMASWTPTYIPSYPVGWTKIQTKFWQYGVYNNHAWASPVPGVTTDVDVDRYFGNLESLKILLEGTIEVPPPTTHEHPELEAQLLSLDARVKKLESNTMSLQCAMFNPIEDTLAYRLKSFNAKDNEIFDFYPSGSVDDTGKRIHINTPLEVCIEPTYLGDSGFKAYLITDDKFLSANKPSCPIFVDASKGHLQLP